MLSLGAQNLPRWFGGGGGHGGTDALSLLFIAATEVSDYFIFFLL
jgi:hypothetical protein